MEKSHTGREAAALAAGAIGTIVRNQNGRLTKRVEPRNGSLDIQSNGKLALGDFRTATYPTLSAFAEIISGLTDREALIHGVAKTGAASGPLATKKAIAAGLAPAGAISRSLDCFQFANGPGMLALDLDLNDAPTDIRPVSLADARNRLVDVAPALEHVPILAMPSASANIFKMGTEQPMRGLSGIRVYLPVAKATDIPEIGRRLHQRLVLTGGGYAKVTDSGVVRVASMLDTSVWSPEHLDFAAGASLGEGLEQRRDPQIWRDGALPLSLADVPALTADEVRTLAETEAKIRADAEPEAERRRADWLAQRDKVGRLTEVTHGESGAVVHLGPSHQVRLASDVWVTVAEILAAPNHFDEVECYDPMEPDYGGGRVVGKVYAHDRHIHSMAHGGTDYILDSGSADEFSLEQGAAAATDDATPPSTRAGVARFNGRFAFVRALGAILHTPLAGIWEVMPMAAWRDYTKPDVVFDGKKAVSLAVVWLGAKARRAVSRLVFEPELTPLALVTSPDGDPEPAFNIWPGLAIRPSREGSCESFLRHLKDVIASGDEAAYRWVLMWLAAIVQQPATLPGTALVLKGPQGAGKDTVGEVMRRIIGPALHTTISDPEQLTGNFNAGHEGKLLLQVEEGFFAGHRGDRGKLKHMVTATTVSIQKKFVDRYEVRNCARILITSNETWVVPAELGDRRFMVLEVGGQFANDLAYHGALRAEMFERDGCARLLDHLLSVAIDWDVIRRPLKSAALRDQQLASLDPESAWLMDILSEGDLPGDLHGEGFVAKDRLFDTYKTACGERRRTTKMGLTQFLKKHGVTVSRRGPADERFYGYQFPPLAECREQFGKPFAVQIEWDDRRTWGCKFVGLSLVKGDAA